MSGMREGLITPSAAFERASASAAVVGVAPVTPPNAPCWADAPADALDAAPAVMPSAPASVPPPAGGRSGLGAEPMADCARGVARGRP